MNNKVQRQMMQKDIIDYDELRSSYEDFCLAFFLELRDKYHFRLSADQLLNFLKIDSADISDPDNICTNMEMFFCHQQYECEKFHDIFYSFYMSEKAQAGLHIKKLERRSENAGENKNVFLMKNRSKGLLTSQKVHTSLPNFKAERFFAQFEMSEGVCDYSSFIHAGFINLYDDFNSYFDSLDENGKEALIDTLTGELSRFIHYCKKTLNDPDDFCRKALEVAATFQSAALEEDNTDESSAEADENDNKGELEKELLYYNQLEDTRIPMSEAFSTKDIRLLNKKDCDEIEKYIRENAHKFKAKVSRNLKKPGKADFDYKETIHHAFRTSMIPMELFYKNPRPRKTKLVCLLDISPSCVGAATVLMHMLHELADVFHGGVEIYFFTDRTVKVSSEIRTRTIKDCVAKITADSKNTVSDYSEALEGFNNNYFSDLTRDSVFILLGDMRNNYRPYRREALARIQTRVHSGHGKTILLNTDPKRRWYADDSVLRRAEKNLDEIYEVRTLMDIIDFLCRLEPN